MTRNHSILLLSLVCIVDLKSIEISIIGVTLFLEFVDNRRPTPTLHVYMREKLKPKSLGRRRDFVNITGPETCHFGVRFLWRLKDGTRVMFNVL